MGLRLRRIQAAVQSQEELSREILNYATRKKIQIGQREDRKRKTL
jgi:hypothetical protein